MKYLPFTFLLLIFSCAHMPKDDVVQHMEKQFEPEPVNKATTVISDYQKELNNAYDNSAIDDYYKEIYKKEKLVIAEDSKMMTIRENLFSTEPEKDLFYFVVFTKSMNGADGFYSEALGISSLKFVKEQTTIFADYFSSNLGKLSSKDLDNWAYFVKSEILISAEGNEKSAIEELEQTLKKNVQGGTSEQKAVIELLVQKLKN